jgi:hypothetical protein
MKAFKIFFHNCNDVSKQRLAAGTIPSLNKVRVRILRGTQYPHCVCVFDSLTTQDLTPMPRRHVKT